MGRGLPFRRGIRNVNSTHAVGRISRSLYARLALVYLVSLIALSLATAWIAVGQFDQLGREWLQRNQIDLATHLARQLREPLAEGLDSAVARNAVARIKSINPVLSIYVLDGSGRVVGAWGGHRCALGQRISTDAIRGLLEKMPMLPAYADLPCDAGRNVFSVARVDYGPQQAHGYLFVALEGNTHMSMARMWQTSSISRSVLIAGIAALLLSAGAGLLLFALLTRRFSRLTRAVQRLADGDHSTRIAVRSDDEIGRTARAFNDMAATIEAQISALRENDRQRRELVANLSHDFRTPLTALRGYAQKLRENATGQAVEQVDALLANVGRLTRLAEQLSLLSRLEIPERALHIEPFPLAELSYDIAIKFRPQAEARDVELRVDCSTPLSVAADLELVDRALSNLIDNALRATDPGGHVTLAAAATAGGVRVSVTDTGIGIPAEDLGLVTQRFYRTRAARKRGSGSGLGLAIVAEVCARHGTRLELASDAHGTTAAFELPSA
ncbi:MAG: HAMP domain-containing histidine kinase [Rhodanobacteraceae bacterium]|nr:MAG: HAMP domain-containing histidine kinase [Rhodanobacteraceae bacterium]